MTEARVEAQMEGEVVRERDQRPVHGDLGQYVPMEGYEGHRADTSVHYGDCKGPPGKRWRAPQAYLKTVSSEIAAVSPPGGRVVIQSR